MAYLGASLEEIEKTVSTINMVCDTMTGNGSTTTMTLGVSQNLPEDVNNVSVYFDGICQRPGTDYTISGKVVTFTTAPENNVKVTCLSYAQEFLDVLSDKTVYTTDIKDSAISDTKIDTMAIGKLVGPLTGAIGNLTNLNQGIISNASDPATNSNKAQGTLWVNHTSGELYACTDATTDNNVWTNIGDGSGTIRPNVAPGMPNGVALSGVESTSNVTSHTFAGGTDTGSGNSDIAGAVTHYVVSNISNASALQVAAAEVAAGQPHVFTTGAVSGDTDVTFDVQSKDNDGALSAARQITFTVQNIGYITATGGVISTFGDYKIHAFTSTGNFNVTAVGTTGNTTLEYLVVAGGGAGAAKASGGGMGGGGGAGGLREGSATASVQSYTATVGAGQSGNNGSFWGSTVPIGSPASAESSVHPTHQGGNSTFNGITSTGGGEGGMYASFPGTAGGSGGGGGGSHNQNVAGGAGNTPSTSPSQGNNGGTGNQTYDAAGGGGAGGVGQNPPSNGSNGGAGGVGKDLSAKFGTSLGDSGWFAGGGGGAHYPNTGAVAAGGQGGGAQGSYDTLNQNGDSGTGGGGGGVDGQGNASMIGGNGGSGIVLVRYKFQN